ncbi:tyrosine-type recombinase/integrase [Maricaulis sp.]|uniref:tyrosine-type recombinase/integrase n=1 Tax=Maricaulis sp. TaxID=1486257 RepID=UPI003A8DB6BE
MLLNDLKIKNLSSTGFAKKHRDGGGLYLLVTKAGGKLWQKAYRYHGKQRTISFGPYPTVSLKEARELREEVKRELANGDDPAALKRERKRQAEETQHSSFEVVANEFIDKRILDGRKPPTVSKYRWTLEATGAEFRKTPVAKITARSAHLAVEVHTRKQTFDKARRTARFIIDVLNYAVATGRVENNVAVEIPKAIPTNGPEHHPGITAPDEVGQLIFDCRRYSGQAVTRYGLEMCALTFLRPGELRFARWEEIDLQNARWALPADRMKKKRPHVVPLSRQALILIEKLKLLNPESPWVFRSAFKEVPLCENTLNQALWRLGYKDRHTSHGFRTTASTILNNAHFAPDWIEAQLAHVEGNSVRAAYNAADYLRDRTEMMQWYADKLDALHDEYCTKQSAPEVAGHQA